MTTEIAPSRVAARRFEYRLYALVSLFALAFALQTSPSLITGLASTPGTLGAVFVGLIVASVVVGCAAGLLSGWSVLLFRTAFALFAVALAVWPFALTGSLPTDQLNWPAAIWPMEAVFLAAGHRRVMSAVGIGVLAAGPIALVPLRFANGTALDAVVNVLYVVGAIVILAALLGAVRQAIDIADHAQDVAATRFAETKRDEVEEVERVRTDALVHDCVLTTLLSAGSAVTQEEDDLSRRMAANALRVLGHVNRSFDQGPAVPFGQALAELHPDEAAVLARFELRNSGTEDLMLPAHVADALLSAMVTVMRDTVVNGTPHSVRTRMLGPDGIRIVVRDGGVAADGQVRGDVAARMRSIDGRAEIGTSPGGGTAVTLSWGSVVITSTAPRAGADLLVVA